ncbi:MAG: YhbY family RNA-binding protein [Eubacteriales bacterium]|jgi:RNA-binding protein|nr:YhbY family RNA-binding protein [Eubacteriales bacterium]
MTGAERAEFRRLANTLKPIFQIGKEGIGDNLIKSVDEALSKRELVKLTVLEASTLSVKDASGMLAEALGAEIIQSIGKKFVLYRKKPEEK